jgi:hypothetical protein
MKLRIGFAIAAAFVGLTTAAPAVWGQSPGDSVTGRISDCGFPDPNFCRPISIQVDAHSGPSGENPTGTALWEATVPPTGTFVVDEGPVTCLAVTGNRAIIGFTGTPGFARSLIRVTDGGSAPGQDTFEVTSQASNGLVTPIPPPDCSSYPPAPTAGDINVSTSGINDLGDIVVRDVSAAPTSKDQCKNGGWKTFSVFSNQGQCVSFVTHGAASRNR